MAELRTVFAIIPAADFEVRVITAIQRLVAATLVLFLVTAGANAGVVGCTSVSTAAQLQAIKKNPSGSYCITADINAGSIRNFQPIGAVSPYFTGRIYGNGHVIRNLKISDTTNYYVGMVGLVSGGLIQDLGLVNVDINGNGRVGGLAGGSTDQVYSGTQLGFVPATIARVYVTGRVIGGGETGGVVGQAWNGSSIYDVWSSANVRARYSAGGVIGYDGGALIQRVYATGNVTCDTVGCNAAGGLIGRANAGGGSVTESFATGNVIGGPYAAVGGLIGWNDQTYVKRCYATGSVSGSGANARVAAFIGWQAVGITIMESFATGHVTGGAGAKVGGFIADVADVDGTLVRDSVWDINTTGQKTSAPTSEYGGAAGYTTAQMQDGLLEYFNPGAWGINKTLSYPYLFNPIAFTSTLATLVQSKLLYTFLPLRQSDQGLYRFNPKHTDNASLATVYTMLARSIGNTRGVATLKNVAVDTYFWHDATQTTTFAGPVTNYATILRHHTIEKTARLDASNVIGHLNSRRVVILQGTYTPTGGGGKPATHSMLATLYTKTASNAVATVVANDPWTGTQVEIDPVTKRVVTPNFPLPTFVVTGYDAVFIKQP